MIGKLFLTAILVAVGYAFVKYPDVPLDLIGYQPFFEKVFSGGSRTFYKLLGILLILIGFAIITGVDTNALRWIANLIIP